MCLPLFSNSNYSSGCANRVCCVFDLLLTKLKSWVHLVELRLVSNKWPKNVKCQAIVHLWNWPSMWFYWPFNLFFFECVCTCCFGCMEFMDMHNSHICLFQRNDHNRNKLNWNTLTHTMPNFPVLKHQCIMLHALCHGLLWLIHSNRVNW